MKSVLWLALCNLALCCGFATPLGADPVHGIAMHGDPALQADFQHLPYVDPNAPKGGRVTYGALGTFDTLNPYSGRGVAALGVRDYVYESLMTRSFAEPFTLYGLLADHVEMAPDRSWIEFSIHPRARFSDGTQVTVEDVIFSHQLLLKHGHPNYRAYYSKVKDISSPAPGLVRFEFGEGKDHEIPMILALMPVLPRHVVDLAEFEKTSLNIPVGSGPYKVSTVEAPDRLVLSRRADYWGKDLPINRGRFNFDQITYSYFRDSASLFEAFKKGLYDVRVEDDAARWAQAYDFAAVEQGKVIKETFPLEVPSGMTGFVFNTRRPIFADERVRRALILLFDFEWINTNMLHGAYRRTRSFFDGSELSSIGHPMDDAERALLAPYLPRLADEVVQGVSRLPEHDGAGRDRVQLRAAMHLLREAGYVLLRDGRMEHAQTGKPLAFEFLAQSRDQERIALAFAQFLQRAGISMTVKTADAAQYQRRIQDFDFDMMQWRWYVSLSPGNEQRFYWGSVQADTPGSRNYAGIRDPAVDAMIDALLAAQTRADFVSAVRALDRVLLTGAYVVPLYHQPEQWVARWSHIAHPGIAALNGYKLDAWWFADGAE